MHTHHDIGRRGIATWGSQLPLLMMFLFFPVLLGVSGCPLQFL